MASQKTKEIQRKLLYNNEGLNLSRGYKNHKYICTQYQSVQIFKGDINTAKGREEEQHNNSGGLQHSTISNG